MNIPEWLGVIGGIAGLAVLLGVAFVAFKGSYNKARIEALRGDLDDSNRRLDEERKAREESDHRIEKLESEYKHLDRENSMLRDMVTQRAEVEAVSTQLAGHHEQAMTAISSHHEESIAALRAIKEALSRE